jgi:hypothetical protein
VTGGRLNVCKAITGCGGAAVPTSPPTSTPTAPPGATATPTRTPVPPTATPVPLCNGGDGEC